MPERVWHKFFHGIDGALWVSRFYNRTIFMKRYSLYPLLALLVSLSSCEVIGGIFKAGMWTGVILVVVVVGLVIFLLAKLFGK
jgi:hypothetical protein